MFYFSIYQRQFLDFTCKGTHTQNGTCTHDFITEFLNKLHMDKLSAGMTMEANNLKQISSNPYPELGNYCTSFQKQELQLTALPSSPIYHETKQSKSDSFHSPAPCHIPKFIIHVLSQWHQNQTMHSACTTGQGVSYTQLFLSRALSNYIRQGAAPWHVTRLHKGQNHCWRKQP